MRYLMLLVATALTACSSPNEPPPEYRYTIDDLFGYWSSFTGDQSAPFYEFAFVGEKVGENSTVGVATLLHGLDENRAYIRVRSDSVVATVEHPNVTLRWPMEDINGVADRLVYVAEMQGWVKTAPGTLRYEVSEVAAPPPNQFPLYRSISDLGPFRRVGGR